MTLMRPLRSLRELIQDRRNELVALYREIEKKIKRIEESEDVQFFLKEIVEPTIKAIEQTRRYVEPGSEEDVKLFYRIRALHEVAESPERLKQTLDSIRVELAKLKQRRARYGRGERGVGTE